MVVRLSPFNGADPRYAGQALVKLRLLHWFIEKGVDVRIFASLRIDGIRRS